MPDELEPRPGESPAAWVARILPLLRAEYRQTSDPAERRRKERMLAQVLDLEPWQVEAALLSDALPVLRSGEGPGEGTKPA